MKKKINFAIKKYYSENVRKGNGQGGICIKKEELNQIGERYKQD